MNAPLLIHIGFHKTGTTWLQKNIFVPQNGCNPILSHQDVDRFFVRPTEFSFDIESAKGFIENGQKEAAGKESVVNTISSEILSGNPFYGARDSADIAHRLHKAAPNAHILVTLREQKALLRSLYMQYLLRSGTMPPSRFFAEDAEIGYYSFMQEYYEYHRLIKLYMELFGHDRVLIVTQERIRRDPNAVVGDIGRFLGLGGRLGISELPIGRIGESYPEYIAPVLRRINHFRAGPVKPEPVFNLGVVSDLAYRGVGKISQAGLAKRAFASWKPISRFVQRRFSGKFAESNRRLREIAGDRLDLSGYE